MQPDEGSPVWDSQPPNESRVLLAYFRILLRNKWLLLLLAGAGLTAGLVYSRLRPPVFQTSAAVEIQGLNGDYLNMRSFDPTTAFQDFSPEGAILTQAKIMERNALRERVVAAVKARSPRTDPAFATALDYASNLANVHLVAGTHILELRCDSTDSQVAADFVNVWAQEYINENRELRVHITQQTEDSLRTQLGAVKANLEQAEAALLAYARTSHLMFTGEEHANVAEEKLRRTQEALSEAEKERIIRQAEHELIAGDSKDALSAMLEDPALRDHQTKLAELRSLLADAKTYMAPGHAKVIRLEAQIAELEGTARDQRARVTKRISNEFETARRREDLLGKSYQAQTLVVAEQAQKTIRYNILKHEADAGRALYESLLQKVKEAGVSKAMRVGNVRLVEEAQAPKLPYKPRVLANALMGLMAGLFLGIAFITLRERMEYNFRAPGESPAWLQIPELGAVPSAEAGERLTPILIAAQPRNGAKPALPGGDLLLAALPAIADSGSEVSPIEDSFRAILASLLFSPRNALPSICLVITSAGPGEGKSTVISNLGLAMAETGRRVLLIDGDLRSPRLHEIFGIANREGLTELLRDEEPGPESSSTRLIRVTAKSSLYVLPAGSAVGNISNLLYSARLPKLLERFREEFEVILIDSPPMMHVPDARVLARVAGAVVLVIRAGQTSRDTAASAKQRFAEDGTSVVGTILNDWNVKEASGPSYRKYYNRNGQSGSTGRT